MAVIVGYGATPFTLLGCSCFSVSFLALQECLLADPGSIKCVFLNLSPAIDCGVRTSSYLPPAPSPDKPAGLGRRSEKMSI
jgi:hypothetical protein